MAQSEQLEQALRKATRAALSARRDLARVEAAHHGPVAIVGVGLRMPGGAEDLHGLWRVLSTGVDTLGPIPGERYDLSRYYDPDPDRGGKTYVRHAALLDDVAGFDAALFGISPREALCMDPQHRLLLEAAWTAIEHAGIGPSSLQGSNTGVFIGIGPDEYSSSRAPSVVSADAYSITGSHTSFAAGRLAYHLGLQGPAIALDTACSSSLVALHLAAEHLRSGRCDLVLAGGVQVIVDPVTSVLLSRSRALSPDGRSKTFSAAADGYGRGEGVGLLALMRLADARAEGRRILGVVRGTAVNHDGASSGITAPNGTSQQKVLRAALANARLEPGEVDVVECHGTGTTLGDPIEVQALDAVFGQARGPDAGPLRLGSIKTNVGHLESASGVAGVLKVLACFQHDALPATLHCNPPNPHIAWEGMNVEVVDRLTPWPPRAARPRRAGVSAFGLSGTNAHVVLEEPPTGEGSRATERAAPSASALPIVLSAQTIEALGEGAQRLAGHLSSASGGALGLADLSWSLAHSRGGLPVRLAVVAEEQDAAGGYPALQGALGDFAKHRRVPAGGHLTPVEHRVGKLTMLLGGQGSQHLDMGRELYERPGFGAFTEAFDAAVSACDRHLEGSIREVMWPRVSDEERAKLLGQTRYTQPALFALETALFRQWQAWGVQPDLLLGHSVGELVAAHVAGVLTLEDCAKLVCARGRLMDEHATAGGAMASVQASEQEVRVALSGLVEAHRARLDLAGLNTPSQTVVSGDADAVEALLAAFQAQGRKVNRLEVSHAFHSLHMDTVLEPFRELASTSSYRPPTVPIISNVTGRLADPTSGELVGADYWVEHARQAVRFESGVRFALDSGSTTFLECGPQGVLCGMVSGCLSEEESIAGRTAMLPSLRKGKDAHGTLAGALGGMYCRGHRVDWEGAFKGLGARRTELPSYAFQHKRYWLPRHVASQEGETASDLGGVRMSLPGETVHRVLDLDVESRPFLADHRVFGQTVLPGSVYLSVALAAGRELYGSAELVLQDVQLMRPLVFASATRLHISLTPQDVGEGARFSIATQAAQEGGERWTVHAQGNVLPGAAPDVPGTDLSVQRRAGATAGDPQQTLERLRDRHIEWGELWWWTEQLHVAPGRAWVRLRAPEGLDSETVIHPGLLDNGFGSLLALQDGEQLSPELPFAVETFRWYGGLPRRAWCLAVPRGDAERVTAEASSADLTFWDDEGRVVAAVEGFVAKRAAPEAFSQSAGRPSHLFIPSWLPLQDEAPSAPDTSIPWVLVHQGKLPRLGERLVAKLSDAGAMVHTVRLEELEARLGAIAVAVNVVVFWRAGDGDAGEGAQRVAVTGLEQLHMLLRVQRFREASVCLWWVTASDSPEALRVAPLWGLARVWQREHPLMRATLVGVGELDTGADLDALWSGLAAAPEEGQLQLGGARVRGLRLVRVDADAATVTTPSLEAASVLMTGGLGGLGLLVARWFVEQRRAAHLVLVGRSSPTRQAEATLEELRAAGTRITVKQCDVADATAMRELLASQASGHHPLRGVVHAAGVIDDGVLTQQNRARFARVMRAKVQGAWNLHTLTRDHDLAFFIMYSSAASLLGAAGQGNYAAANAFLDALAWHRRAQGLPAQSINWGPWSEMGMAASAGADHQSRWARAGFEQISPTQGLEMLQRAMQQPQPQLCALRLNEAKLRSALGPSVPPLWQEVVAPPPRTRRVQRSEDATLRTELEGLPPDGQLERMRTTVRAYAAEALGQADAAQVPSGRPFKEQGFDSLMAMELRNALSERLGQRLPATLAFDYPTVDALAAHLLREVLSPGQAKAGARASAAPAPQGQAIAIVAMACRYPGGVSDPEGLWEVLDREVDTIGEVPKERWDIDRYYDPDPDAQGKMSTRSGGFLTDVEHFDAAFFNVSAREAQAMDPQQRLLLETSWEALERGGVSADALKGSDTGVFVGLMSNDYAHLHGMEPDSLDGYVGTGNTNSVASGRISYTLGLKGPSVTLDTACSSSLVALHLACQSLRTGECGLALAGGVTVILTPTLHVEFSRLRGLSPDGRCKSFGASADGVGWGEGCGMLLLKRLSDARADGDPVLAVIRGTAVNQDGKSNGLTAPNGPSQEAVIRRALSQAELTSADIDYVEAHGTGTTLGDPIEAQALGAVFAQGHTPQDPLLIGSAKSNLGHTQAAAGVAGVIKTVLAMGHGHIPASLHSEQPSSHIAWDELALRCVSRATGWPARNRPPRAGVSSFGISGTNAHVILEGAPPDPQPPAGVEGPGPRCTMAVLSARHPGALREQAQRLRHWLGDHQEASLHDVAQNLAGRSHLEQRVAVVVRDRRELDAELAKLEHGEASRSCAMSKGSLANGRLAFLFTGQGSQYPGMGQGMYAEQVVFRDTLDECAAALATELSQPLLSVMFAEPGSEQARLLDQTAYTQAALFALELGLARTWHSWGVAPDVLLGHSVGELAAACFAGVFSLQDGLKLVAARGRLMQELPPGGAMVSVRASAEQVRDALAESTGGVALAAINGPSQTVLSGPSEQVGALAERFAGQGVKATPLIVSHAFHSPLMEPMLGAFRQVAEAIDYRLPQLALVSNVTGRRADERIASADYWVEHVGATVQFARGVRALHADGIGTYLEVGPSPTLSGMVRQCLPVDAEPALLPSLRKHQDDLRMALRSLGQWYVGGGRVDWRGLRVPWGARHVTLPTYPFQRRRYWLPQAVVVTGAASSTGDSASHVNASRVLAAIEANEAEPLRALLQGLSKEAQKTLPELKEALARAIAVDRRTADARSWFYRPQWQKSRARVGGGALPSGRWLLLSDQDGLAAELGKLIEAGGGQVISLARPPRDAGDCGPLEALLRDEQPFDGVVCLWGASVGDASRDHGDWAQRELNDLLYAHRAARTLAAGLSRATPCWFLTRGAVVVDDSGARACPAQAAVWGLARVFGLEQARLWGGLIDLPGAPEQPSESILRHVAGLLGASKGEDHIAVRASGEFVQRLVQQEPPATAGVAANALLGGTAVVTGGLGALGLHAARWAVKHGAARLVLIGRRGMDTPGAQEAVAGLQSASVRVSVAAADVCDPGALARMLDELRGAAGPVAILHAAGVEEQTPLLGQSDAHLVRTVQAKIGGAALLDALTRDLDPQFFVCFSSIAGVWGSAGQACYAAANAYLDALMQARRAAGHAALSVSWGPWSGGGMAQHGLGELARRGVRALPPDAALAALDLALGSHQCHQVVSDTDWATFRALYELQRRRPLVSELPGGRAVPVEQGPAEQGPPEKPAFVVQLASLPEGRRATRLSRWLLEQVRAVLGREDSAPVDVSTDVNRGFFELGMDSLMTVELRDRIHRGLGCPIESNVLFDHPDIRSLAGYLLSLMQDDAELRKPAQRAFADEPGRVPLPLGERDPVSVSRALDEELDSLEGLLDV